MWYSRELPNIKVAFTINVRGGGCRVLLGVKKGSQKSVEESKVPKCNTMQRTKGAPKTAHSSLNDFNCLHFANQFHSLSASRETFNPKP